MLTPAFVRASNRSTQHYAYDDFHPAVRKLERAGIIGDRPA